MGFSIGSKGGSFKDVSVGLHPARCAGVVDIGTQHGPYGAKKQMIVFWDIMDEFTDDGRPLRLSKFYAANTHPESTFSKDLMSWRGKPFTAEEKDNFEPFNIIGAKCQLNVVLNKNNRTTVDKVLNASKVDIPESTQPQLRFSIEDYLDGKHSIDELPEWIQNFVKKSDELTGQSAPSGAVKAEQSVYESKEDDVPF